MGHQHSSAANTAAAQDFGTTQALRAVDSSSTPIHANVTSISHTEGDQVSAPFHPHPSFSLSLLQANVRNSPFVQVQHLLLKEDVADDAADLEEWSVGNIIDEYTKKSTGERLLRIRFTNGDEQVICQVTVHRPVIRNSGPLWRPSPQVATRPSPQLSFSGHESSAEGSDSDCSAQEYAAMTDVSSSIASESDLLPQRTPLRMRSLSPSNHRHNNVGGERMAL
jgi:hypothetical protein